MGIELDNRLVVDGSSAGKVMGLGSGVVMVNQYGDYSITASFNNDIFIFPEFRPIKIQPKTAIKCTSSAIINKQTWVESNLGGEEIAFNIAIAFFAISLNPLVYLFLVALLLPQIAGLSNS